jgi:hypothetical protein
VHTWSNGPIFGLRRDFGEKEVKTKFFTFPTIFKSDKKKLSQEFQRLDFNAWNSCHVKNGNIK